MSIADDPAQIFVRPCPFITFYSFKGGVGRSMALINVAGILAARGFSVLVIDMDLEAPGLSYLANPATADRERLQRGFVDLLLDAVERGPEADLFRPAETALTGYSAPYELPEEFKHNPAASLHIMPAGCLDDGYAGRLERLDLPGLYRAGHGLSLIMAFKQVVQDSGRFDYVFIDSRTGFSDESGICTRDLADYLMVVSGLNKQNVEGTAHFLAALRGATTKERAVEIVLSPVPNGEDELVDRRTSAARAAFEHAWGAPVRCDLQIPYHPQLALTEEPHIFRRRRGYLYEAYHQLEKRLREHIGDTPGELCDAAFREFKNKHFDAALARLRRSELLADTPDWLSEFTVRLTSVDPIPTQPEAFELYTYIGAQASESARNALADSIRFQAQRLADRRALDEADAAFKVAIHVAPQYARSLGQYADFLCDQRRDMDYTESYYRRAVAADPKDTVTLGNYASFSHTQRKSVDDAEDLYKRAIATDTENANNLGNYANFLWEVRKNLTLAEFFYKRAIATDPEHAIHLTNYANFLWKEQEDLSLSESLYERAITAEPNNPDTLGRYASFLHLARGDYDSAESFYTRAIAAAPEHANNLGNYAIFLHDNRKEHERAETIYKRALNASPSHANNLGNYARLCLMLGRVPEGIEFVERAIQNLDPARPSELDIECWMYVFCCGAPERRPEALHRIHSLLTKHTIRTGNWDFSGVIAQAVRMGHPDAARLPALAEVLAGRQPADTLADWEAWQAAGATP